MGRRGHGPGGDVVVEALPPGLKLLEAPDRGKAQHRNPVRCLLQPLQWWRALRDGQRAQAQAHEMREG